MQQIEKEDGMVKIKAWVDGVPLEAAARSQLYNVAELPIVWPHIAVMPDVHFGVGATVGSVIPTFNAIIPAAVGVDIGCGMMAVPLNIKISRLTQLKKLRDAIENLIPVGKDDHKNIPSAAELNWRKLQPGFNAIIEKNPEITRKEEANAVKQLGTLGGGNHFIEVCHDEEGYMWLMLHSGSRNIGNRIGTYFIQVAKEDMKKSYFDIPDKNLAYLTEGTQHFKEYTEAMLWAQDYAKINRSIMMDFLVMAINKHMGTNIDWWELPRVINCHHNYAVKELHFGQDLWITRKGAISAREGEMGIIPGSMGVRSFIVAGKGNPQSFSSASHGAGRTMARGEAKRTISMEQHEASLEGVECRKDAGILDESPAAYKDIDAVMAAQTDLVEIKHTLKQVLVVKG